MKSSKDRKVQSRFMQLLVPALFLLGLVLTGGSELAKEKWKNIEMLFTVISSIGSSLFAGATVTFLYNHFIKEFDASEIQNLIKQLLKNLINELLKKDSRIHRIIYFVPTLLENEFYHELLHQLIILSGNVERDIQIVVKIPSNLNEKGIKYHDNEHGYIHELKKLTNDNNTLLVIVPCVPDFHFVFSSDQLVHLQNIITIDMEVPDKYKKTFETNPSFLANIRTENKQACKKIAMNIWDYFLFNKIDCANIIICEGNFHDRGRLFMEFLCQLVKQQELIKINFFPEDEPVKVLDFGDATNESATYIATIIPVLLSNDKYNRFPVFIFCANDNIGIGARNALIKLKNLGHSIANIKIICYDYSSTVRNFIKHNDEFIYFSSGQDFRQIAQRVMDIAIWMDDCKRSDPHKPKKELTVPSIFKSQRT